MAHTTTVLPFRSLVKLTEATGKRMRETALHEWRDKHDTPYHISVDQAEPLMEGAWSTQTDGTRQPEREATPTAPTASHVILPVATNAVCYPQYHTQQFPGLLDRSEITEQWFENGTLHLYSHHCTAAGPYDGYDQFIIHIQQRTARLLELVRRRSGIVSTSVELAHLGAVDGYIEEEPQTTNLL